MKRFGHLLSCLLLCACSAPSSSSEPSLSSSRVWEACPALAAYRVYRYEEMMLAFEVLDPRVGFIELEEGFAYVDSFSFVLEEKTYALSFDLRLQKQETPNWSLDCPVFQGKVLLEAFAGEGESKRETVLGSVIMRTVEFWCPGSAPPPQPPVTYCNGDWDSAIRDAMAERLQERFSYPLWNAMATAKVAGAGHLQVGFAFLSATQSGD